VINITVAIYTHAMMNDILASIDSEINALKQVRAVLAGTSHGGRKAKRKYKTLSAEARAKISAAQKKRWAKQKRAAK
jgi:hypothetical protein